MRGATIILWREIWRKWFGKKEQDVTALYWGVTEREEQWAFRPTVLSTASKEEKVKLYDFANGELVHTIDNQAYKEEEKEYARNLYVRFEKKLEAMREEDVLFVEEKEKVVIKESKEESKGNKKKGKKKKVIKKKA